MLISNLCKQEQEVLSFYELDKIKKFNIKHLIFELEQKSKIKMDIENPNDRIGTLYAIYIKKLSKHIKLEILINK